MLTTDDIFFVHEESLWAGSIYGVRPRLLDIVQNIFSNSYKAIGKKIDELSGEEKENYKPAIRARLEITNDKYIITITDNGIGMPEETIKEMFKPFGSASVTYARTGIGLYIIRRMVENIHGGAIRCESEYMKGTAIYIELPKKPE